MNYLTELIKTTMNYEGEESISPEEEEGHSLQSIENNVNKTSQDLALLKSRIMFRIQSSYQTKEPTGKR